MTLQVHLRNTAERTVKKMNITLEHANITVKSIAAGMKLIGTGYPHRDRIYYHDDNGTEWEFGKK